MVAATRDGRVGCAESDSESAGFAGACGAGRDVWNLSAAVWHVVDPGAAGGEVGAAADSERARLAWIASRLGAAVVGGFAV